jgi:predicted ATPase/DNA-binding SARP family transcriptional activator
VAVQVGVLGPVRVTVGDVAVDLGSVKQRRLLVALLVDAGRVVSIDRLIAALWGDAPPATALASLRTYVYRLRSCLGADDARLHTRPPGYVLEVEPEEVDAHRFDRLLAEARDDGSGPDERLSLLEEALALWRGPAYAEFADEGFARAEALRLEEARRLAIEERFELLLSLGCHAVVVGEIEGFVAANPLRDRARGHLMVALYRCGRQADALATYEDLRRHLGEELGLEVPEPLQALQRAILQQAPSLDPPATRATTASSARGTDPHAGTGDPTDRCLHGLPAAASALTGRDDDLTELERTLAGGPVVSVVGPGGVGKSRLALDLARQLGPRHRDGVWWCELAPVDDPADVAAAVATALGIRPGDDVTAVDAVASALTDRKALLVLDNCEHVVDPVAQLVGRIARSCPSVSVLTTSRRPLGIEPERVHLLRPLHVSAGPDGHDGSALELFVERGRAVRPDLDVTAAADRAAMVEICRRLDGLPLAIELAASRLRALNPVDLAQRLRDRLDLLTDRQRATDRHRALRATLAWSYDLLGTVERRAFDRLSVFAGPFTLEAAEAVVAGDGIAGDEVLDLLTGLVDHSLVALQPGGGVGRYTMLETLRAFGHERLREVGEDDVTRRRHAAYHVALAEDSAGQVRGRDEALGVTRLNRALANLRAAHRWCIRHGETDLALRLSASLLRYATWRLRDEVLGWAAEAAALTGARAHERYPMVAGMAGWAAGLRGDLDQAADWAREGLASLSTDNDPRALVPYEVQLHVAMWSGELDTCLEVATRAREVVDDPLELVPHYAPGLALTYAGRPADALTWMEPVQAVADRAGNPSMRALCHYTRGEALLALASTDALAPLQHATELAAAVQNRVVLGVVDVSLGSLHARHGDPHTALRSFTGIIDRLYEGRDWTHLWTGLRGLVSVLARLGHDEDATTLLGAVREADNAPPPYGDDADRLAELAEELTGRLGAAAFTSAYTQGRAMTDHDAVAFARRAIDEATNAREARPTATRA